MKLYDPKKEEDVKHKLKIMYVTCNLGGRAMGRGRNANQQYQELLD